MLVNGIFLFDRMNGMFHLTNLLHSFVPNICRVVLMIVNFLALSLCFLDNVRILRYIQLNIMLISSIVLCIMQNSMPLLDDWSLLLFVVMMSWSVVVFCFGRRLMTHFPLLCISNSGTVLLFVLLISFILHMTSIFWQIFLSDFLIIIKFRPFVIRI